MIPISTHAIPRSLLLIIILLLEAQAFNADAQSQLHLYRPKKALSCALAAHISVDDTVLIKLSNGELRQLDLTPGMHTVGTRKTKIPIEIKPDGSTYVRVFFEFNFLFGRVCAVEVTEGSALAEIRSDNESK